jgi:hypothetical protein
MRFTCFQTVTGAAVLVVLSAVSGSFLEDNLRGTRPGLIAEATGAEPGTREELRGLLKARYETASRLLDLEEKRLREGVTTLGHVCEAARWLRDSAVELPGITQERLTALTNYVALTRRLEESINRAEQNGAAAPVDKESARYLRLDAEVTLVRAKLQISNPAN